MTSLPEKSRVAFLGLGIMGAGMARCLLGAGFPLTVYNRNAEKAASLAAEGAQVAATPREAAVGAEFIVSMLSDDAASRGVWLGDNGALAGAARGTVLLESSTLSVGWVRELAAAAHAAGCEFLDVPVTGSKAQAAAGELSFFAGGAPEVLEKARRVLAPMSRAAIHLGPTGSGALLKLINNFLSGVQAASLAEAMALIEKAGLNRDKALELLTAGSPGSPIIKTLSARMAARDYTPNFLLRLLVKDLAYAAGEGRENAVDLSMADAALAVFRRAVEAGYGEQDMSAVVEPLR